MNQQPEFPNTPSVTSPLPAPALAPRKKSFVFQAAKASLFAPFIAFGLNVIVVVGNVLINGLAHPSANALKITLKITITLFVLFTVSGFILGIVSLFGVRRHGKKGILGYAIAGILLNGLPWVVITASSIVVAYQQTHSTP
jgi:hypothetical protein